MTDNITKQKKHLKRAVKKKNSPLYNILMVILIGIICYSGFNIGKIFYTYYAGSQAYTQVQTLAGVKEEKEPENINFDTLLKENPDVKGWIYLKNSNINYPILQAKDNAFYLRRLFNKEWNIKGSIFIDYRNINPFESFNTVVYGHKVQDGTMFSQLAEYKDKNFYKTHKNMTIYTPKIKYNVEIFGGVYLNANSDKYKFDFADDMEKSEFLKWIKNNSFISTNVNVSPDDKIVMFSTCTEYEGEGRTAIFGKLKPAVM